MKNLVFIYRAIKSNGAIASSKGRLLNPITARVSPSIMLGMLGTVAAVSFLFQTPAQASLSPGDECPAVGTAQSALLRGGFPVGQVDDVYGNETETAVEQFQSSNGLSTDGIIGPVTAQTLGLNPNISCSSAGEGSNVYVDTNGDPLNVHAGPGESYGVIGSLADGTPVQIVGQQGDWGQITSGGWVSLDWIAGYNNSTGNS
ncbi:MAG TPA: peptidoglycan-binding protein [Crinalium sp.]|jgi:peptidoglycan hydrolase-like protein with peptidoglycan-binding domain